MTAADNVLPNLTAFIRGLGALGFKVDPGRTARALQAFERIGLSRSQDVRDALKAVLVSRPEEVPLFDLAWEQFIIMLGGWGQHPLAGRTLLASVARLRFQRERQPQVIWAGGRDDDGAGAEGEEGEGEEVPLVVFPEGASRREVLRQRDFASLTEEERIEMERWAMRASWPLWRRSRRWRRSRAGRKWDVAATLRRTVTSPEMMNIAKRLRGPAPRPVVMLCDVSGSMEPYSRMVLRFARAIQRTAWPLEVFVFSTRLTHITRALAKERVDVAIERALRTAPDFGGGTRLAHCLGEFNRRWARRVMRRGAVAVIVSDGLDSDDPEELSTEMARLARFSRGIVWLHPDARRPGFEPTARGMAAALPYIDRLLPGNTWAALEEAWLALTALSRFRTSA